LVLRGILRLLILGCALLVLIVPAKSHISCKGSKSRLKIRELITLHEPAKLRIVHLRILSTEDVFLVVQSLLTGKRFLALVDRLGHLPQSPNLPLRLDTLFADFLQYRIFWGS
jgi:hypothetical protein